MPEKNELRSEIKKLITESYQYFETGNFSNARKLLDRAHALDFENPEVSSALRACGFWDQRQQSLETLEGDGNRGDYLRRQWNHYQNSYRTRFSHPLDEGTARLKRWVFNKALSCYLKQASDFSDSEAYLQAGRCRKALGRYEESITTLEEAVRVSADNEARLLAELADTYALIGESRPAKVLMREALFINATAVELNEIQSPLFRRLIERMEKTISPDDSGFTEWLAVYGTIWGVLDVTRELSPVEYGKLKQKIYALKNEIADGDSHRRLTPKLINHYFRLIDHYRSTGAGRTTIEEILMEIKLLSPAIYRIYIEN